MKHIFVAIALLVGLSPFAWAQCRDNIVLVHGNTSSPSSWNNTREQLYAQGYTDTQIFAPNWGSKTCVSCNDHNGSEELPVREAILDAINQSCSGKNRHYWAFDGCHPSCAASLQTGVKC
ncbi:esterase/lipase family protein [Pseudoalteromonas ruthenica]|uniref:esterase/lipase family protein n=1 Tax=Pseudoalteromonas ruthenica TaxID=151081 RepID=UPI0026AF91F2